MSTSLKEPRGAILGQSTADELTKTIGSDMKVGISYFSSWMIGVGAIIGSIAWLFHGIMIARAGTLASALSWIVAGVIMLPLALIIMELSSIFPTAGGPYIYKYYALKRLAPKTGELLGFLTGWLFWIDILVGLACMSNGLANLLSSVFWGNPNASPLWFGPIIILTLFGCATILNLMQVQSAARLNNLFTLLKFAMAIGFGSLVLFGHSSSIANALTVSNPEGGTDLFKNVASVIMLALSGYVGIEMCACTSSETANAQKSVPKAILMTLLAVGVIYFGMCVAISAACPYVLNSAKTAMIVAGTNIQATCPAIAGYIGGPVWGTIFTACVVASIIGCGFGGLMGTARLGYSMAKTGLFPAQFAELDPKTRVPNYALVFQFWCLVIIGISANLLARTGAFPDAYTFLAEVYGFMYAFIALLYGVSAVSLRYTDPHIERPFRVGKQGNGLLWLLASVTILIWGYAAFGCVKWTHQLAGSVILLAGIPIYNYYRWRRESTPSI